MARPSGKIDLTQGPIFRRAIMFALPLCIGAVLQQLYGIVDTMVVGNFCGAASVAAVGTSSQPVELLLCIFMGLGTGVSILVSQHTGSGDKARQRAVVSNANVFLYLCALPLSILGLFIGPVILRMMQVPEDAWAHAVSYIRILFLGTLGNLGYNVNAGILRGVGDSRSTLYFLFLSCVMNIVLDLLFVAGLGMDVTGAALATAISMYASWIASALYIRRKYPELGYTILPRGADKQVLREIIRVGLPLGLNNSIYSVGHFFLQVFINSQGSVFMAACSIGGKVNSMASIAVGALSSSATAFAGQNLGAKRYDRLVKGGLRIPLLSGLLALVVGLLVTSVSGPIVRLFGDDPAVLAQAQKFIYVVLPFYWTYAVFNGIIAFVNGMGIVRYPTVVNILMLWAVRIPAAWLIMTFWEGTMIMASYPISFSFGMISMLAFFLSRRWREIRRMAREQATIKEASV